MGNTKLPGIDEDWRLSPITERPKTSIVIPKFEPEPVRPNIGPKSSDSDYLEGYNGNVFSGCGKNLSNFEFTRSTSNHQKGRMDRFMDDVAMKVYEEKLASAQKWDREAFKNLIE